MMDSTLLDEIGATAQQRVAINAILDQREQETRLMWREWEARFDTAMKRTRGQIRSYLSEEQIKRLNQAIAERRARRKQAQSNR
jgi:hypothetical protein